MRRARLVLLLAAIAGALGAVPAAHAGLSDEEALAARFAPVVRLVSQPEECGPGEPYKPLDVNLLFDDPTVALRGPWNPTDLVKIGPGAKDIAGLYEYHLDFPGDALDPGCNYEKWQRWLLRNGGKPTIYAHVAADPAHPGKLALQYWFFYVFNDFNNLHEGDWEMIQLNFDAADAAQALNRDPVAVGYSSHEGAELAHWDDSKLELIGNHPVVYPAAGSHANKYTQALYLGSSAEAGVGCDDTRGPHNEIHPVVKTIPSDPAAADRAYPWIDFQGRWGELHPAFFNGPTGPNLKSQWTEPITWSEGWRSRSYAVPTGGVFGTSATDFFCVAVATGSRGLIQLVRNPAVTLVVLALLAAIVIFAATRTRWRPSAPLHLAHRRHWGQILTAAGRMYFGRARLFLAIGLLFLPLSIVISLVESVVLGGFGLLGIDTTGESAGLLLGLVLVVGATLTLTGLALVQAATAFALVDLDEGRRAGPLRAYRMAFAKLRPLTGSLGIAVVVCVALGLTTFLLPVAVWLAVRWALIAQTVAIEDRPAREALRRSARLVRGHWFRVATLVGVGALLVIVAGPLIGALLIVGTDAPLPLLNVVAGIVYALAMPYVALTTTYVYFDARVREELEPSDTAAELPSEIEPALGA